MAIKTNGEIVLNGVTSASTVGTLQDTNPGAYVLANNARLYEPQRENTFTFTVTDMKGLYAVGTETVIANAQEFLTLSVVSTTVPHFTQGTIEVRRSNSVVKFAGVPTFASGTLVVNDFIGADSKGILMAWQRLSYDVATEKVGLAKDYKKDAYLCELTPDGQTVRKWLMHGCWISGLSEDAFNVENNGKKQVTATIEYDYAELTNDTVASAQ